MLVIRKKIVQKFEEQQVKRFADEMCDFFNETYPNRCKKMGQDVLHQRIHTGIIHAGEYGFTDENDLQFFLAMQLVCGQEFHQTETWARQILEDKSYLSVMTKMNDLFDTANERYAFTDID